jgi:hypothetical protein
MAKLQTGEAVRSTDRCRDPDAHRTPPSQSWRTFLRNQAKDLIFIDFFVVPTAEVVVSLSSRRDFCGPYREL